jgi:homoserine/homoserine lactone efflux protein
MSLALWLTYVATLSAVSFSPGTGAAAVIASALSQGASRTFPVVLGMQAALLIYALIVGVGLAAIVAHGPALQLIRWSGVVYLVWLGLRNLATSSDALASKPPREPSLAWSARFTEGLLVNLTNPKTTVFMAALFPQFVRADAPIAKQLMILCATLVVVDTIVMMGYAHLASGLRTWLNRPGHVVWLNRIVGIWFLALATMLAMGSRHG